MNTTEVKQIEEQAIELGVASDWERGFLSDVIRRGKNLSSKQIEIVKRIKSKVDNYDDSKIPQWVKTMQACMNDEEYTRGMDDWSKRFIADMIQRGQSGRAVESFSPRQQEILNGHLEKMSHFQGNREEVLAEREARRIEWEQKKAAEEAARQEQIRLMSTIITESGYERVHALISAAAGKIQQPSITVKVVVSSGREVTLCFQGQRYGSDVHVRSSHKKEAVNHGIINDEGLFTFNATLSAEHREAAKIVAADPLKAVIEYGHASGCCSFCRKDLTDMRSVSVGYGPICAKKFGLPWSNVNVQKMTEFMVAQAQSVRSVIDASEGDDSMKTTQSIKCNECGKYALHPSDYQKQANLGRSEYFCDNGCSSPIFEVSDEKVPARFVVETPREIIEAYKIAFGLEVSVEDAESVDELEAFSEPQVDDSSESISEQSESVSEQVQSSEIVESSESVSEPAKPVNDGLFWTTDGKSFKSRQGRYNYCKRTGAGYR